MKFMLKLRAHDFHQFVLKATVQHNSQIITVFLALYFLPLWRQRPFNILMAFWVNTIKKKIVI